MRFLSGVQPSGPLHLGNYFGAVHMHLQLQNEGECFFFIANYHSLTTVHNAEDLERFTREAAADYLALGLDPRKTVFFRQSDVPEVQELSWLFASVTGMGLLERAHAFKDKVSRGISPSVGLFYYPVLMAADILLYGAEEVPVGADQVQHVEMARDMAGYFHQAFGKEVFVLPKTRLSSAPKVPGVLGGKMSKSDPQSVIPLIAEEAQVRKQVMRILTDSKGVHEPKDPEACLVFQFFRLVGDASETQEIEEALRGGKIGYGEIKKRLAAKLEERFGGAVREKKKHLLAHPEEIEDVLEDGARRARRAAAPILEAALQAAGLPVSRLRRELLETR